MISKQEAQENIINIIETDSTLKDAKQERIEKIKELLPNVINSDNQIDIKALQDLLGSENTTSNNQGYELTFAGKGLARAEADRETTKELKVEEKQSKNFDETGNVIIRGDNIDCLKIMYKNYHNKIKMIYIDPPYNTKSENFIYKDNFKQSDEQLIKEFGLGDDTANFLDNVYGTRSHSGWLSFMYPRLMLAKELLTDDGVIFISIGDEELANLKIMCDEIFGEDNFVANFIWEKRTNRENRKAVSSRSDYILCYCKARQQDGQLIKQLPMSKKALANYKNRDNDPRGAWKSDPATAQAGHGTKKQFYTLVSPSGKEHKLESGRCWLYTKEVMDKAIADGRIWFGKDGNGVPRVKTYLDAKERGLTPESILFAEEVATNETAKNSLKELFEGHAIFETPKPVDLLKNLLLMSLETDSICLDFFAGSGTTAHAVMQQNAEDGGNRKFILCQWDEKIDPTKSEPAYEFCTSNKFEPVISSITIERVNRAGEKIKAENPDKQIDIGYKVFSHTEKPRVDYDDEQRAFSIRNERAKVIDTLVNMLIATCKPLDTKLEIIKENAIYTAENEIYVVGAITAKELEPYKDLQINIDALVDFNLTDYLNIDLSYQENIRIVY